VELITGFNQCTNLLDLIFAMDGNLRHIDGFSDCVSLARVEFPPSVEVITGFNGCKLLSEVEFAPLGRLKEIKGFEGCDSLREVDIPQSVVRIQDDCFQNCRNLLKVTFAAETHLQMFAGFHGCRLKRIQLPRLLGSVSGLHGCSFEEIVIPAGGRVPPLRRRVFITFQDDASIAQLRRNFQTGTSGVAPLEWDDGDFVLDEFDLPSDSF
jgi:hypothetical protein